MVVKIINKSKFPLPEYKTLGSSGMDLRANIEEPVTLGSLERKLIPSGIYVELPEGTEIQVRPRSGLALKNGLTVLNTPGTIDSDYRGEIGILLINLGKEEQTIMPGDRVAQMVCLKYEKMQLVEVDSLSDTFRGEGGYGHSGIQ